MVPAERLRSREGEKKSRLELSRYSHNLTNQILRGENGEVGKEISNGVLHAFQVGSLADRDSYWQEKEGEKQNFGTQMLAWMGRGEKPGISQWVAKQSDADVAGILQEVGLKSTPEKTKNDLQEGNVVKLLTTINADLAKVGKPTLSADDLSEDEARSLIFYSNYLTGERGIDDAKSFINTVVGVAERQSGGNLDETITKLQKITPLLNIAGEEAQYTLGALMVAKAHVSSPKESDPQAELNEDEERVAGFINKHLGSERLQPEEANNIEDVYRQLKPKPTPGHAYWIEKAIPVDFAEKLTDEQIQQLEMRKPLFLNVRYEDTPQGKIIYKEFNREVFDPAYALENDQRFRNAELLTYNDSGIFALAAASAATPEQQARLYQQLGETILRAHEKNPKLLEDFLLAQPEGSREALLQNEAAFFIPQEAAKKMELNQKITEEIHKKFPQAKTIQQNSPEAAYRDELIADAGKELGEYLKELYGDINADPLRLFAVSHKDVPLGSVEEMPYAIDVPATITAWSERIKDLQQFVTKDPLELTLEEIRQIEFLGHSVDTVKVMEWLQGKQSVDVVQPVESIENPEGTEVKVKTEKLGEFLESIFPKDELPRRQEMTIPDATQLSVFSTAGQDIRKYEIGYMKDAENEGSLVIYTFTEEPDGRKIPHYNMQDTFLNTLFTKDSVSDRAFFELTSQGFLQNTLLAYVLEASATPKEQATLFKNLFLQVAKMYEEHDELRDDVRKYLTQVNEENPFGEAAKIEPLFGSLDITQARIQELTSKLEANGEFSLEDFQDMGMYALPLNLQYIAQIMETTYQGHKGQAAAEESAPQV